MISFQIFLIWFDFSCLDLFEGNAEKAFCAIHHLSKPLVLNHSLFMTGCPCHENEPSSIQLGWLAPFSMQF